MKAGSVLTATALAALVGLACEPGSRAPDANAVESPVDSEWEWLFDGTSLDKWRGYRMDGVPDGWVIEDSVIHCTGVGAGDLMTKAQWENFDLRLEWKISEGGNSGIMYRSAETHDAAWLTGPELQILDDQTHADAAEGPDRLSGAAYDVYGPSESATSPVGEWNDTRILVDSTHVEHWLNGVKVVEYDLFSDDWNQRVADSKWAEAADYGRVSRGHIALQDHGDDVWFRNIRIRALPDSE